MGYPAREVVPRWGTRLGVRPEMDSWGDKAVPGWFIRVVVVLTDGIGFMADYGSEWDTSYKERGSGCDRMMTCCIE